MDDLNDWWKSLSDSTREALLEDPRRPLDVSQIQEVKQAVSVWWVDTETDAPFTLPGKLADYVESLKDSGDEKP